MKLKFPSVFLILLVFYGTSTTVIIYSYRQALKQSFAWGNGRSSVQESSKPNESIAESIEEFVQKADTFLAKIQRSTTGSPAGNDYISHSLPGFINYLKRFVFQVEKILEKTDIKNFLSQPVINNHTFPYIHNPGETCTTDKVRVFFAIPSAPNNFMKRQEVRNGNRGKYAKTITNNAKMLFFLGRPARIKDALDIQKKIEKESRQFRDIVQEDFEDFYNNNRFKSVSILRWASTYCPNAKYVIRADDDITANMSRLVSVLDRTAEKMDNFILGRQRVNDAPGRNEDNKYYLSENQYPHPTFPPFVLGGLVGYPITTVQLLYEAALRVKPIWLEDVYISGLCAPKVHVSLVTDPDFTFQHPNS